MAGRPAWIFGAFFCLFAAALFIAYATLGSGAPATAASGASSNAAAGVHLGVASCSGSTCHGRQEADGAVVRQDELLRWQEPSSASGAHSRAFAVLSNARSQDIARRLGLASASDAAMCLGCHAEPAAAKGPRFQTADGVGCEACHGASGGWIDVHTGGNHAASVAAGLIPLENPRARASVCLDCHFGSDRPGQFVNHRIMAAGHPRVSFELDLFTTLQAHHDEDADYIRRKGAVSGVRMWAVGQAVALERALTLHNNPKLAQDGIFPEFYFFDCHTCHRTISDETNARASWVANPGRPIPSGMPAFNDENMIMLAAAARAAAPQVAGALEADSKAFHAALARDRSSAIKAGAKLRATATRLADAFGRADFSRAQTFAILDQVTSQAIAARYTDYEGSVQAVMAADTLLGALVKAGHVSDMQAAGIRGQIDIAYAAVKDPNDYRPMEFRAALGRATSAIRALR